MNEIGLLTLVVFRDEIALQPEGELHDPATCQDRGADAHIVRAQAGEEVKSQIEERIENADDGGDGEIGYIPAVDPIKHEGHTIVDFVEGEI